MGPASLEARNGKRKRQSQDDDENDELRTDPQRSKISANPSVRIEGMMLESVAFGTGALVPQLPWRR